MKILLLVSLISFSLSTQVRAAASCAQLNHDADDLNRVINNKSSGCVQGSQGGSVNDHSAFCHSLKARNNSLAEICSKMKCDICPSFYNNNAVDSYPKGDWGVANPIVNPSCGGDGQPACSLCGGNGQPACGSSGDWGVANPIVYPKGNWGVANPVVYPPCGGNGQPACSNQGN